MFVAIFGTRRFVGWTVRRGGILLKQYSHNEINASLLYKLTECICGSHLFLDLTQNISSVQTCAPEGTSQTHHRVLTSILVPKDGCTCYVDHAATLDAYSSPLGEEENTKLLCRVYSHTNE